MFPGKDYVMQMDFIFEVMGTPDEEDMQFVTNPAAARYIESSPKKPGIALSKILPKAPPLALDLLFNMLQVNPMRRYTAAECLSHPYLARYRGRGDESKCLQPFRYSLPLVMDRTMIPDQIWEKVFQFRPFLRPKDARP